MKFKAYHTVGQNRHLYAPNHLIEKWVLWANIYLNIYHCATAPYHRRRQIAEFAAQERNHYYHLIHGSDVPLKSERQAAFRRRCDRKSKELHHLNLKRDELLNQLHDVEKAISNFWFPRWEREAAYLCDDGGDDGGVKLG